METLLQEIVTIVGGFFDVPAGRLDPDVSFAELGADSMSLLGMLRVVEDRFDCKVPLRQLFGDIPTSSALAAYVAANAPGGKLPGVRPVSSAPASVPVPAPAAVEVWSVPAADAVWPTAVGPTSAIASAPTVGSPAAGDGAGASTAVERVIQEQLLIMRRQLDLLADGAARAAAASDAVPAPVAQPVSADVPAPVSQPAVRPTPVRSSVPLAPGARGGSAGVESAQRAAYLRDLAERFGARTKGSKDVAQRFRQLVADSRSSIGFRPSTKEMLYPIAAERGQGARLWDVDGNEYVDLTLGWGVHLLGHNPPVVMAALRERMEVGFVLAARTELVEEVAAGLLELTGMERVAFLNSGTEAVMTALRIARVSTGRDGVVVFSTAYHGHADSVLAAPHHDNGVLRTRPITAGIPSGSVENVHVLEFGTDEALDYIDRHGPRLAAVMTEPVTLRTPGVQNPEFLRRVREITQRHGTKLIFDEMVTGFRCHPAGVQGLYGIEADLATYGKIIGGGMPIGVIAGRGGIMDAIDGGVWNFGDDSRPTAESTFFAGTFNQHPLTMAAAKAVLDHLREQGPGLQRDLDRKTEVFVDQLNADFRELDVPIDVRRFSSLFRFEHEQNLDPLYFNLLDRGVFVWELRNFFLSTAHEQADLDHVRAAVRDSVAELREHGVLGDERTGRTSPTGTTSRPAPLPATLAQRQQAALDEGGVPAYEMSVGFWLEGPLNRDALRGAVRGLVTRHESLRTTLDTAGGTLIVQPATEAVLAEVLTEHSCPTEAELGLFQQSWAGGRLDIAAGPVFRVAVAQVEPERHLLVLSAHHAAVDGWSFSVLVGDFAELYNAGCRGAVPQLPPAVQFRDYVTWHERIAGGSAAAEHREYWHALLKGAPALELPMSGEPETFPYRAVRHSVRLDAEFCDRMRDAAREQGTTVFALLVAAWGAVLHRVTGQDDIVVPVLSARRPQELDPVVGFCSNLLPLRLRLSPDVLAADYVAEVLEHLVTGLESQDHPFAELVTELAAPGTDRRGGLSTTSISFYRQVAVPVLDGLTVSEADPSPISHTGHPLALNIVAGADGFRCDFEFAADALAPGLVERVPRSFRNLLGAMVSDGERPLAELDHDDA